MEPNSGVVVIGAGLAGSECAWILAEKYGIPVTLFEMKSQKSNPAQTFPNLFAELVCSNSLKSTSRLNPAGLLKEEMRQLGSLLLRAAQTSAVPAGETLAVDREQFSSLVTDALRSHPLIQIKEAEVVAVSDVLAGQPQAVVVASGPLTADALAADLRKLTGTEGCYFYDAIAPILDGSTINLNIAFRQNRQMRADAFKKRMAKLQAEEQKNSEELSAHTEGVASDGEAEGAADAQGDYLNLPLNKEQYFAFVEELMAAEKVPFHEFEKPQFFNGCQPIESLAASGPRTLAFGPMKARGITNPATGRMPYAVVQLRKEDLGDAAFNMVGFQTRLTWPEQRRIFRMLPGLENVEFFRMGSMHRNTYFVSSQLLAADFSLRSDSRVFLAGQITGVEGYIESASTGLLVGHILGRRLREGKELPLPPSHSALGALVRYALFAEAKHFSPMNIHWGLFDELSPEEISEFGKGLPLPPAGRKLDKAVKRSILAARAERAFGEWKIGSLAE